MAINRRQCQHRITMGLTELMDSYRRAILFVLAAAALLLMLEDQLLAARTRQMEIWALRLEMGCPSFYDGFCDSDNDCCINEECDMSWPELESHSRQCIPKQR